MNVDPRHGVLERQLRERLPRIASETSGPVGSSLAGHILRALDASGEELAETIIWLRAAPSPPSECEIARLLAESRAFPELAEDALAAAASRARSIGWRL